MRGYAPACRDEIFAGAREQFAETEEWLAGEAAGLQHAELEEQLAVRGRELMRWLFQGHLDLLAAREERHDDVAGEDGVARPRAERGRTRPLVTRFGQVRVSRIAYRSPGRPNVHLLDAALNLPEEKHSHGLRELAAAEAARGSMEAAQAAIERAAGAGRGSSAASRGGGHRSACCPAVSLAPGRRRPGLGGGELGTGHHPSRVARPPPVARRGQPGDRGPREPAGPGHRALDQRGHGDW